MTFREWSKRYVGRVRRGRVGDREGRVRSARRVCVDVSETVYGLLQVLGRGDGYELPADVVVEALIDHAQQGVHRPEAWQRGWLMQVFGDEWLLHVEPGDPYARGGRAAVPDPRLVRVFSRPRRTLSPEEREGRVE